MYARQLSWDVETHAWYLQWAHRCGEVHSACKAALDMVLRRRLGGSGNSCQLALQSRPGAARLTIFPLNLINSLLVKLLCLCALGGRAVSKPSCWRYKHYNKESPSTAMD